MLQKILPLVDLAGADESTLLLVGDDTLYRLLAVLLAPGALAEAWAFRAAGRHGDAAPPCGAWKRWTSMIDTGSITSRERAARSPFMNPRIPRSRPPLPETRYSPAQMSR